MKILKVIGFIAVFVSISSSIYAQGRRALVIGVGEYKDPAWDRINADNDINYVTDMLGDFHFDDVTVLRNSQATKQSITRAFDSLCNRSDKGDIIYIHFSGHGQRVKDLDGDEEDGYDESWVPYDAYNECCAEDRGEKHLIDDEVHQMLSSLRSKVGEEGQILVLVDACHSGKSTRALNGEQPEYVCRGARNEFVPTHVLSIDTSVTEDWILLSACEDYQVNSELRKPRVGKLTYCMYLLRAELPLLSNDELIDRLADMMESADMLGPFPQNPCYSGNYIKYMGRNIFN